MSEATVTPLSDDELRRLMLDEIERWRETLDYLADR